MATADELTQLAATLAKLAHSMAEQATTPPPEPTPELPPERVLLTAEEAAERLGIGRTLMYRLIRTGEIESVRIGRLRRVPTTAIHDYATRLINSDAA
ncbi:helix-turn-helix domain-containing protein [Saccharomonospora piscinae]|uniref:helix-turn-helix domain-containing protein n=1 Tax=Saccharomonospora piscinae TaxID=687388 RepID=UPI000465ACA0|nr:helix-turn-helix domain-containing protein [Saccharomonospora piscinae]